MTNITPLDSIIIPERQRKDYPDLESLAKSLSTYGLIQPIVLSDKHELIAGGRRLAAARSLGWVGIPYVTLANLSPVQREELELEENIQRADLTWQEQCCAIAKIHRLKSADAALAGEPWGFDQTGAMLGRAKSNVWYAVQVAERINANDTEVIKCDGLANALRLLLSRKEKEAATILAKQLTIVPSPPAANARPDVDQYDLFEDATPPVVVVKPVDPGVYVRDHCILGDAIDVMSKLPDASVDHIYTDPPYGIDMANLQQANGDLIDRVVDTHQVDANLTLNARFLEQAWRVTKDTSLVVFWCDIDNWAYLKNIAEGLGFQVQRWPIIWLKVANIKNEMAYHNFAKSYEVAMLLRKPQARIMQVRTTSHFTCPQDNYSYNSQHPFWKPIALHNWILTAIAQPGARILDPFAGEGSIEIACIRGGFDFLAVENTDIHYVQLCRHVELQSR